MLFRSTWNNGGPGNMQVNRPFRSVDAVIPANGVQNYYIVGDAETNADNQPAFGSATYDPAAVACCNCRSCPGRNSRVSTEPNRRSSGLEFL